MFKVGDTVRAKYGHEQGKESTVLEVAENGVDLIKLADSNGWVWEYKYEAAPATMVSLKHSSPLFDDETEFVTSDTGGTKGKKSVQMHRIPVEALAALSKLYTLGASKYPDDDKGNPNWPKGTAWSLMYDALQRHAMKWQAGEDSDPETGISHMIHVAWNAIALYYFQSRGVGKDDRGNWQ